MERGRIRSGREIALFSFRGHTMSAWGEHRREAQRQEDVNGMRRGPFYDTERGELRIPSYIWNARAVAEWKRRGLAYDSQRQEWFKAIPQAHALTQTEKARLVYFTFWTFEH